MLLNDILQLVVLLDNYTTHVFQIVLNVTEVIARYKAKYAQLLSNYTQP